MGGFRESSVVSRVPESIQWAVGVIAVINHLNDRFHDLAAPGHVEYAFAIGRVDGG